MNRILVLVVLGCVAVASAIVAPLMGSAKADNLGPHTFSLHDSTYNVTANGSYEQLTGLNQIGCHLDYEIKNGPTSGFQLLNITMALTLGVGCSPTLLIQNVTTASSAFTGSEGTYTVTSFDGYHTDLSEALEYTWAGGVDNQPSIYYHYKTAPSGCNGTNIQTCGYFDEQTCCYSEGVVPTCSGGSCPIQVYDQWDVNYYGEDAVSLCGSPCTNHMAAMPYAIYNVGFADCDNHGNYYFGTTPTCSGYQSYAHLPPPPGY